MPAGGASGTPDAGGMAGGAEANGGACQLGDGGAGLGAGG
jgi:hypothetical protein